MGLAAAVLLFVGVAHAQTGTVTGSVAKLPLEDIDNPQVYHTITSSLLEEQVVTSFEEAMTNAPGVFKLWESTGRGGDGAGYALTSTFYCLLVLVALPYTVLLYDGNVNALYSEAGYSPPHAVVDSASVSGPAPTLQDLRERAEGTWSSFQVETVSVHERSSPTEHVEVMGTREGAAFGATGGLIYHGITGDELARQSPADARALNKVTHAIEELHFAQFGGTLVKVLFFFLALASCGVIITGNLTYLEVRHGSDRAVNRFLAQLTAGLATGMLPALGLLFLSNRVLPEDIAARGALENAFFFGSWLAAILYTQLRADVARSHRALLRLGGVLALLIPLANGITTGDWLWSSWSASPAVFGVDLGALLCGFGALVVASMLRVDGGSRETSPPKRSTPAMRPPGPHRNRQMRRSSGRARPPLVAATHRAPDGGGHVADAGGHVAPKGTLLYLGVEIEPDALAQRSGASTDIPPYCFSEKDGDMTGADGRIPMTDSVKRLFFERSYGMRRLITMVLTSLVMASAAAGQDAVREVNPPDAPSDTEVKAIVGATLIDGRGGTPIDDATVVVRGTRIAAAGSSVDVPVPESAARVDGSGLTVVPGLIDAHFHLDGHEDLPAQFLQHGVTSVRDPGAWIAAYDGVRRSEAPVPRLFLAGPHLDTPPPAYPKDAVIVRDEEETRLAVERAVARGASAIKVYFRLPLGLIETATDIAHEHGIPVTAHLEIVDARDAIGAGVDGVEHVTSFGTALLPAREAEAYRQAVLADNNARREGRYRMWSEADLDSPRAREVIDLLASSGVFMSPTLGVFERRAGDEGVEEMHVKAFERMVAFVGMAERAGAVVVVGSHSMVPHAETGWAYHREMELLVEAGLTPMEAIVAGTSANARFFRIGDRLGTVEPGKQADLVLVEGNPADDISAMRRIRHVMLNGRWVR